MLASGFGASLGCKEEVWLCLVLGSVGNSGARLQGFGGFGGCESLAIEGVRVSWDIHAANTPNPQTISD